MEIIDEIGRIGGVINVIDVLVILFTTAVAVAGLTLIEAGTLAIAVTIGLACVVVFAFAWTDDPTVETVHATLDLGTQPPVVAQRVVDGELDIFVTDTFVTPADTGDGIRTIVRTQVDSRSYQETPNTGVNQSFPMPR
ncbi:hypothetical protein ACFQMM_09430 [Saliphagus sp. GCM10025308]